jgi:hypothetical protein
MPNEPYKYTQLLNLYSSYSCLFFLLLHIKIMFGLKFGTSTLNLFMTTAKNILLGFVNINLRFFFLDLRKPHPPESALYKSRWASKTPAVPGSYKRCMPWLEFKTYCVDFKLFAITLYPTINPRRWRCRGKLL